MTLDLHDVQGLVARGYGHLGSAAFLLLTIEDAAAGRRWLGEVSGAVTSADVRRPNRALHVAFTSTGLERLGLDRGTLELFSNEFVTGMTTPHRTRILGDLDENAPARWEWGGPAGPSVDAVLLLYALNDRELTLFETEQTRALPAGMSVARRLGTCDQDGIEPFGFRDGVSQPFVEGLSKTGPPENTVKAGEFLLGYENEYGLYTDRPLLDPSADPDGLLPRDAAGSGRADLGRNGSYLVFRQLRQDVPRFWHFVDSATRTADGRSDPAARVRLAAKMVGRWPSGAPLTLAPDADDPALADANDFAFHEHDRRGARCPIGSHIRRSNPRDSLDPRPGSAASFEINRRHRLLRRGREYGTAAVDRGGAGRRRPRRPRSPLRLPERQHPAPVRVRQPHLAEQPEVRRPLRRRRPARRAVGAARGDVHDAHRRRPRARDERPSVRLGQGRRLLPPPRSRCASLSGRPTRSALTCHSRAVVAVSYEDLWDFLALRLAK